MSTFIQPNSPGNLFDDVDDGEPTNPVIERDDDNEDASPPPTTAGQPTVDDPMGAEDGSSNMDDGNANPEDTSRDAMNEDDERMQDGNNDENNEPQMSEQQGRSGKKRQGPRSIEILDEIYNPELYDKERSLWQFWLKELKHLPDVDSMARDLEARGLKVDMEQIHYDWFHNLLRLYREHLQTAFGDSLELPVLGRRLQRFQESSRSMCSWRYEWIRKYKEQQEAEALLRKTGCGGQETTDAAQKRREAALARRQAKLQSIRNQSQDIESPDGQIQDAEEQRITPGPVSQSQETQDRHAAALARRQAKLQSLNVERKMS
eukprot:Protomagalhaensia_sp_Gyna_25__4720@NODE_45_length_6369_cov_597_738705_g34_i0_p3_GENE_NODE_45_length_6369_cov_597_738705_g34_i0NODE_45_length_6369_cov_597_738705_g34_i0_p3_ORF_typecomplete_len319_score62_54_NODE_45_length_6369_cov_597_738705_g34_i010752031